MMLSQKKEDCSREAVLDAGDGLLSRRRNPTEGSNPSPRAKNFKERDLRWQRRIASFSLTFFENLIEWTKKGPEKITRPHKEELYNG